MSGVLWPILNRFVKWFPSTSIALRNSQLSFHQTFGSEKPLRCSETPNFVLKRQAGPHLKMKREVENVRVCDQYGECPFHVET